MATNKIKIGDRVPDFTLEGVDGKKYNLYSSIKEGAVVVFSCNHCPYVQAYEERIKKIQEDFALKGIQVLAISSNDVKKYPEDSFDNMKNRAKERKFNFPYLWDETQQIARAYDATHTPEIFLVNKNKQLVFHGKIDDNWQQPDRVKNNYLKDAITEMLEGKEISVPETFTIGCTIKWKE
jgi:peroxiredoxin